MAKILTTLSLVLLLFLTACLPQPLAAPVSPTAGPTEHLTPTSTRTPTATPTRTPTVTPKPTSTPTASPTPRVVPEGRVTILILGSDQRPNSGFRTDVIVLLTVDTMKDTVSAVSFPRDLYVDIPGWKKERINTAMPHGGFELLAETFESNFGVRPEYYVMTNMAGFMDAIDRLGGITVSVGSRLEDECPWSTPISKKGHCVVEPGRVEMDGETALWYVRSRHTSNDFDRLRRAQEVLLGTFYKLMNLNAASRLPEMFSSYKQNVQTNMTAADIAPLLPTAVKVLGDYSRISRYTISPKETTSHRTETRAAVLLPDFEKIMEILDRAVFAP